VSERARLRNLAGLTQYQLSTLTGVPQAHLCQWERNDRQLRPEQVERIARILNEHIVRTPVYFGGPSELVKVLTPYKASTVAA